MFCVNAHIKLTERKDPEPEGQFCPTGNLLASRTGKDSRPSSSQQEERDGRGCFVQGR